MPSHSCGGIKRVNADCEIDGSQNLTLHDRPWVHKSRTVNLHVIKCLFNYDRLLNALYFLHASHLNCRDHVVHPYYLLLKSLLQLDNFLLVFFGDVLSFQVNVHLLLVLLLLLA